MLLIIYSKACTNFNDIPQLTDIREHHVIGDSVMSSMLSNNQVVSTLLGTDLTVTISLNGDVFIDTNGNCC